MYKTAYKYDGNVVFYFDLAGNKYVASGGSLAWRINNPALCVVEATFPIEMVR